jgi:putative ABC transport system substrate-binding protein
MPSLVITANGAREPCAALAAIMRVFAFFLALGTVAVPFPSGAQTPKAARTVTIGYLGNSSPSLEANLLDAFREGMREHGYVEGKNLVIQYRWAAGHEERYADLARELVRLRPDIVLTAGTPGTLAAMQATRSIPIVAASAGDPVAAGLVSTLAKPGGNVTGLSTLGPELEGKRLQLFKQAVPSLSRVTALMNPANPFTPIGWKATQAAAERLGVKLLPVEVQTQDDLDAAFAAIKKARPDGLIVVPDRVLLAYRAPIVKFIAENGIPAMFAFREFAQEGGLMAYGPDYTDVFRRAAGYVNKILNGAKPGDLPVEEPTKFELVINMKTAKALRLTIPQSLLVRAERIIE